MNLLAPPRRVLVRTPSWLGDFIASEPVLRALHRLWSAHGVADRLTFAGPASFLALLDGASTAPSPAYVALRSRAASTPICGVGAVTTSR